MSALPLKADVRRAQRDVRLSAKSGRSFDIERPPHQRSPEDLENERRRPSEQQHIVHGGFTLKSGHC